MKKKIIFASAILMLFVLFTILVKTVDVKPIGRQGSDVGFAAVNKAFRDATGYNEKLYKITDLLGYAAFAVIAVFGCFGLRQMIKRRSILKVDRDILLLGGFYLVVLFIYVLFEKVIINYRPICNGDETLEASYPSSHTLLFVCVMYTAFLQIARRVRQVILRRGMLITISTVLIFEVLGRALCGVHWLTDIIGGIILSLGLVLLYSGLALNNYRYFSDDRISREEINISK